jgi:phosphotriesterase-related protein
MSRRQALTLFGAGAGLTWAVSEAARLGAGAAGQRGSSTGPSGTIVRTVLGDVAPAAISGTTLMHEHLGSGSPELPVGGSSVPATDPTRDVAWMLEELTAARKAGLGCIVAAQTVLPGPGNVPYLERLARATGLHIVAAGAYYSARTYPKDVAAKTEDEIADDLVRAATSGRYGAFGEFGMLNDTADLDPVERKVFRAVARAQARTGIPIFTHCNYSTGANVSMDIGLRQLDVLESAGASIRSVAIGHVCCLDDPMVDVATRIAKRGAFVAFDRVTRQQQWVPDEKKASMVRALVDAGLVDQILLSSDYIGRINDSVGEVNTYGPLHTREGGPGYARPVVLFLPHLRKAGVDERAIARLMVDNPRRFLTFEPRGA